MNLLENNIVRYAKKHADKPAIICGATTISYQQLQILIGERATALRQLSQKVFVTRASQTADFIITYLAAHLAGKVIVPLENSITDVHFQEIESLTHQSHLLESVADVLFTTGTTGQPKGTMITHTSILANAENLIGAQGFSEDITFVINGPLNHIGSLSKLWPVLLVGATLVITDGMKDMGAFLQALELSSSKVATFLVPTSLRLLLKFEREHLGCLSSKIDFIETGAAPMSQADMEELCALLPHTRLYNTYASTETGIIATHDYQNDGCLAGCLGKPMQHSKIVIAPDGHITCMGDTLMAGYIGNEKLTHQILRDGVLHTSDIGYIDEKGRLRLEGRTDDMINIGGFKVFPIEVENVALQLPFIADCICIRIHHSFLGNVLKLLYVTDADALSSKKSLIAHLKKNLEPYKVPLAYEQTTHIERTYNGKLNRKFYQT